MATCLVQVMSHNRGGGGGREGHVRVLSHAENESLYINSLKDVGTLYLLPISFGLNTTHILLPSINKKWALANVILVVLRNRGSVM